MLTLIIGGVILVGLTACIASDPEYVKYIKEAIYWLVKSGYETEKIAQIMHVYLYY
jgi:hypothetical protein